MTNEELQQKITDIYNNSVILLNAVREELTDEQKKLLSLDVTNEPERLLKRGVIAIAKIWGSGLVDNKPVLKLINKPAMVYNDDTLSKYQVHL